MIYFKTLQSEINFNINLICLNIIQCHFHYIYTVTNIESLSLDGKNSRTCLQIISQLTANNWVIIKLISSLIKRIP